VTRELRIVDGTALLLRPWFAGVPRADRAAFAQLRRHVEGATHAAVVMDVSLDTFRRDLDPAYKAHRVPADGPLIALFDAFAASAVEAGVPVFAHPRFEADDFAATLCRLARAEGLPVVIHAADKDLFQLVTDTPPAVRVVDEARGWKVDEAGVRERLEVEPGQVVDYLALVGDTSDGVRGVPGVGPRTAAALLVALGSLDRILAEPAAVAALPIRGARTLPDKLAAGAEIARLAQRLVRLRTDAPLPPDPLGRCARP
jgi:DNA polymerase-1